jgi:23S rRNA (cytidine1920-2'-O)/16S rRNA (cytidine1409-2'-O)-methyltransferase
MTGTPRVRIDTLLVTRGLFESRARACAAIAAGLVRADGTPVRRAADRVPADAVLEAREAFEWVSRGGVKLAHALDIFAIDPTGWACLDAGASTGGFTEVLLARGARHVVAVDVGHGQLHARLRGDPRIDLREGQDIRTLAPQAPFDLIVADLSFVSLTLIAPALCAHARAGTRLVALVKPQFEVGRAAVGKGGVVRDPAARAEALARVQAALAALDWHVDATTQSPVTGADGNLEWLLAATYTVP